MGGIHGAISLVEAKQKVDLLGRRFGGEIARLAALDVVALRQRWAALFGDDPSPNFGRALLIRAIAYRLQEKALAGLKPSTQRLLDRIADNRSKDAPHYVSQRRRSMCCCRLGSSRAKLSAIESLTRSPR